MNAAQFVGTKDEAQPSRLQCYMPLITTTTALPSAVLQACRVVFGARAAALSPGDPHALAVALPVLAGPPDECLLAGVGEPELRDGFMIFRAGTQIAGFALANPEHELETAAADLYRRLFAVTQGFHLQRIWNYIPDINAVPAGLENYRRFCRGRSLAFEKHFGRDFEQRLPAASGVGALRGPLALAFLAGTTAPRHFENPQQIPAFHYPPEYGPRAPSFSRATVVAEATRGTQLYISGTAAIRGHATVAPHDLERQVACTVENLNLIGTAAGAGRMMGGPDWSRQFKVYLRHAADLEPAQAQLQRVLLQREDRVSYLQADLCRADLLVEIEAVLSR